MSRLTRFFKMTLTEAPTPVREFENVIKTRTVYKITPLSGDEGHVLRISAPKDFPQLPSGEYITIRDAYEETGLSVKTLRDLCKYKIVEAQKVKGKWLLGRNSLFEYLENSEDHF